MGEVEGLCAPGWEPVRKAFRASFTRGEERGASVAVTRHGEPVVDLWGGDADGAGRPWERDTLVNVYSLTKTMAALCTLMLADRGQVDLDAPVATYWPAFAANGKDGILLRHVLGHTAGVSGFDPPLPVDDLYDWDLVCDRLAAQAPWWEPGTASGYHALTQGHILGEVLRRVDGRTMGTFFREEVAEPLGADFHLGLPRSEEHRVAEMVPPRDDGGRTATIGPDASIGARTLASCPHDGTESNTRAWREAEIPAAGGTGNARSVARIHSALALGGEVDGVRLLSGATVDRIFEVQADGPDLVLGRPMRFGMGFGLIGPSTPLSPNERAFFWGGWGGSMAVIDLDAEVSIAYAMNRMADVPLGDMRAVSVIFAAYAALKAGA